MANSILKNRLINAAHCSFPSPVKPEGRDACPGTNTKARQYRENCNGITGRPARAGAGAKAAMQRKIWYKDCAVKQLSQYRFIITIQCHIPRS
ncbi:MAG: hypothetical protein IPI88_19265, partial [Chitinophagaceae bacterium]|nr:hypothetical protein [Chitinophagaceae bacterium]